MDFGNMVVDFGSMVVDFGNMVKETETCCLFVCALQKMPLVCSLDWFALMINLFLQVLCWGHFVNYLEVNFQFHLHK